MIYVEGDGYLASKNYGFPAVYYDAVGDIAGARLGPYPTQAAAQADYAARKAARKQVPVPVEWHQLPDGWYAINPVWGTSNSHFQIRVLDDPTSGNAADRWRVAEKLRDPLYASRAAFVISDGGKKWDLWSSYRSGDWEQYGDHDWTLVSGHPSAEKWNY